ncbi:MAG: DUF3313 domain-containing protein [Desulfobulbaceae bacterium]|nr:DUF3313 domain-containing protein [Desulfobulbaceae bacterium]
MAGKKNLIFGVVFMSMIATATWATAGNPSSFISGSPAYTSDANSPGALVYRKPGVDTSAYTKVLIDPIEIWVDEDSKYKGLSVDESKAIADTLRQVLTKELEPAYPVVNTPGKGVLGIRLAITHVFMKNKKRGLLGYTPIGLVMTTAANLAGLRMELNQATIEAELLDGETNEQIFALIEPLGEDQANTKLTWEEVGKRLEIYAKRLRAKLDEGQTKTAK